MSPQTIAWTFRNIGFMRQREVVVVVVGVVVVAAAVVS